MSTESEAGGGGFWRGFFTGFFLLFIATVALIVFFPMAKDANDTMAVTPGAASSENSANDGSGSTDSAASPDDGAALAPEPPQSDAATPEPQPQVATDVQAPAAADNLAAAPQAPSAGATGETPLVAAIPDPAPLATNPVQNTGATISEPDVSSGDPPSAVAVADPPQSPSGNAPADQPVIAQVQDPAPVEPAPAPVAPEAAIVAQAPDVASGGGTSPAAPTPDASPAPVIASVPDQTPEAGLPAPVSGDAAAVEQAPAVASAGGVAPTAPVPGANAAGILPGDPDREPLGGQPAARIAAQTDGIADHGVSVVAGSEIGTSAKTLVTPPVQGNQPGQAEAASTAVPGQDDEIVTAMAPVTGAPDAGDDAAVVDTTTASKPRQRPEPPVADGPAFEAFAAEFNDKKDRPLLAIILQDVGEDGLSRESLISIKLPVTYALAIDDPEAPWSDALYRENGFEVLAMVPQSGSAAISRGQPRDQLATQLPEYFDAVPGAIGILDRVDGEIQRDNNLVKALIAELKPTGLALLMNKGSGFGSAVDLAKLENVPSISITRLIDPDRSPATIRANLDRAALQASKTGSAVVIGRTYPETVTTLVRWLLGGTARSVTVAPVSAAIRR